MPEIESILENLRNKLKKVVEKNKAEGLLFSGGLDSAILAFLSPQIRLFTVTFESRGDDLKYARNIAKFLNLELYHRSITEKEAIDIIPVVIKALKSFDPAIPNDITVYFGLEFARKMGLKKIMTGDGSDELFAGYSYMHSIGRLDEYIKKI
ncbi:hypothetical protein H5U35_06485, partial [Candidatus Aerophobetes bacterium]|nr:hypothetical protein [Candidatus Aerophobetes bacterium]